LLLAGFLGVWIATASGRLSAGEAGLPKAMGRLHVVLLHAPIGLLVGFAVAQGLAGVARRWRHVWQPAADLLLSLAGIGAVAASCAGLLLATSGDYAGELLQQHKTASIAFTLVCLGTLAARLAWRGRRTAVAYAVGVAATLALMGVAGHLGGSLTHGRDYLIEAAPAWIAGPLGYVPPDALREAVQPVEVADTGWPAVEAIFARSCLECHNAERQKAGFRLDTYEAVFEPGHSELAPVVPFRVFESYLADLITLPPEDDLSMPPAGHVALSADEIVTVLHWIARGAPGPDGQEPPASAMPD
jgi:uncharacterized membrane protein